MLMGCPNSWLSQWNCLSESSQPVARKDLVKGHGNNWCCDDTNRTEVAQSWDSGRCFIDSKDNAEARVTWVTCTVKEKSMWSAFMPRGHFTFSRPTLQFEALYNYSWNIKIGVKPDIYVVQKETVEVRLEDLQIWSVHMSLHRSRRDLDLQWCRYSFSIGKLQEVAFKLLSILLMIA